MRAVEMLDQREVDHRLHHRHFDMGALAGAAYFFWRRGSGQAVLGTIVAGMSVYIPLHLGLHW